MLKYRINWEKAIEAITWLACQKPGIDFIHVSKVLFYADKAHLQRFARPILGDTYIAMEYGPVPSGVRDLLTKNEFVYPDLLEAMTEAVEIDWGKAPSVRCRRQPRLECFSETDLDCLAAALDEYGEMPLSRLRELTHDERAWMEAPTNGAMDYELMIDEDLPDRKKIIEEIRETAAYAVL